MPPQSTVDIRRAIGLHPNASTPACSQSLTAVPLRPAGVLCLLAFSALARIPRMARGAPKVTVTREGDSLCQKWCYPMALLFLFFRSLISVCFSVVDCKLNEQGGE